MEPVLCDNWKLYRANPAGDFPDHKHLFFEAYFPVSQDERTRIPQKVKDEARKLFGPGGWIKIDRNDKNVFYWPVSKLGD